MENHLINIMLKKCNLYSGYPLVYNQASLKTRLYKI